MSVTIFNILLLCQYPDFPILLVLSVENRCVSLGNKMTRIIIVIAAKRINNIFISFPQHLDKSKKQAQKNK